MAHRRATSVSPFFYAFVVSVALVSTANADGRPAVLQAEALLAENTGDVAKALTLLRAAHAAAPDDIDIAFDRARIALDHASVAEPADLDDFLSIELSTADQQLLRAYILIARDRHDDAEKAAREAIRLDPGNAEATTLLHALAPGSGAADVAKESSIAARFRLYGQYDTNTNVLPDRTTTSSGSDGTIIADATNLQRSAAGIGAEADVRWIPVRGITELSFLAGVSFLGHVTGRSDDNVTIQGSNGTRFEVQRQGSKTYDYGTVDLQTRLRFLRDRWNTNIELYGSTIFIDDYASRYLSEGTLLASTSYAVTSAKAFRIGAYGLGAIRSFGDDYSERDGTRFEGGLTLAYAMQSLGFGLRGGYQTERTEAASFTEKGQHAMAYVRASAGRVDAVVAVTYQHRDYDTVTSTSSLTGDPVSIDRTDNRLGPQIQLSYAITDDIAIIGSYLYMRNVSTVDGSETDYDYARHLANLGIEARL